jgi:hypothetical protein
MFIKKSEFNEFNQLHGHEFYTFTFDSLSEGYQIQRMERDKALTLLAESFQNESNNNQSSKITYHYTRPAYYSMMEAYNSMSDGLKNDNQLVKTLINFNPKEFQFLKEELRDDIDIINHVLSKHKKYIEFVSSNKLKDKNFAINFLKDNDGIYLKYFKELLNDVEVVESAISNTPEAIFFIKDTPLIRNKELITLAIKGNTSILRHVPPDTIDDDLSFMAFDLNPESIVFFPENNNPEKYITSKFWDFFMTIEASSDINLEAQEKISQIRNVFLSNMNENIALSLKEPIVSHLSKEKTYRNFENIKAKDKVNIVFKLGRYLSYILPYWSLEDVQQLANKSMEFSKKDKDQFSFIFETELTRRSIQNMDIHLFKKDEIKKKDNIKKRKLSI